MNRSDLRRRVSASPDESLVDLPLRSEEGALPFPPPREGEREAEATEPAAGLEARAGAFAADAATVLLFGAAAVLAAAALTGEMPSSAGLPWAAAFGLLLSCFVTVFPLVFFGRTVGMAVAGLAARRAPLGRRLRAKEAMRRWFGTLATAGTLGIALLFTLRSAETPTPADRWSGRPLEESVDG